jgi:cysteinyl-tRNA synthetase
VYKKIKDLPDKFQEAMDDDFNTPRALGYIFDSVRLINGYLADKGFVASPESLFVLDRAKDCIREVGKVLGLFLEDPDEYFEVDRKREAHKSGLDIEEIERLIGERREARAARDWEKADSIRDSLAGKGVILKDSPAATTWKIG